MQINLQGSTTVCPCVRSWVCVHVYMRVVYVCAQACMRVHGCMCGVDLCAPVYVHVCIHANMGYTCCVHVCARECVHEYMCGVYLHAPVCVHMQYMGPLVYMLCVYACVHVCMGTGVMCICVHLHLCACVYLWMCMHVPVGVHVQTYGHT